MPKGDVDILISARDEASARLKKVRQSSDQLGESFKRVNQGGGIEAALSTTALSNYSGELGRLVDLTGDYINAQKGSQVATAAAIGVYAAAAAVVVKGAVELVRIASRQDEYTASVKRSIEAVNQLNKANVQSVSRQKQVIEALGGSEEQKLSQLENLFPRLNKDVAESARKLQDLNAQMEKLNNPTRGSRTFTERMLLGRRRDTLQEQIDAQKKILEQRRDFRNQLSDEVELREKLLKQQKLESSQTRIRAADEASQKQIFATINALERQVRVTKLGEKTVLQYEARIRGATKQEIERIGVLHDTREALKRQKELQAEHNRLKQQAATATERLNEKQTSLAEMMAKQARQRQDALTRNVGPVNAVQSRFLTRGVVQADPVLKENEQQTKLQKDILKLQGEMNGFLEKIQENTAERGQLLEVIQ